MTSLGTWPSAVGVKSCRFEPQIFQIANASPYGGSEQVLDLLNDRWVVSLVLPVELFAQAAAVEAFLGSFRGQVNTVNLWHFARPQPRGTFRGSSIFTHGVQPQGASVVVLDGPASGTVLAGDLFGIGGQIVMASADATANSGGTITVPIVNRLRNAIATGQPVTWDKPTAPFRMLANTFPTYAAGITDEIECTLGEAIA